MEFLNQLVNQINGLVWGPPMLVLILGTGFFLMVLLKLMPLRRIGTVCSQEPPAPGSRVSSPAAPS